MRNGALAALGNEVQAARAHIVQAVLCVKRFVHCTPPRAGAPESPSRRKAFEERWAAQGCQSGDAFPTGHGPFPLKNEPCPDDRAAACAEETGATARIVGEHAAMDTSRIV